MSKFTTRHVCPVPMCNWYVDNNAFSKTPSNSRERMRDHLNNHHPIYFAWLKVQIKRKLRRDKKVLKQKMRATK